MTREHDWSVDSLPLVAQFPGEVDAACSFDEDVKVISSIAAELDPILFLSPIQGSH